MLSNYIPPYLLKSSIFQKLYENQQNEIDDINLDIEDLLNQCFVSSATWGLKYWEEELGLSIINFDTYENRRSRIKAKLRGVGTTTVAMIKNVAESFQNGEVNVIEDNTNYSFTIKFIDTKGIPPNIQDIYRAIELIKPAHLGVSYEFRYTTWSELSNYEQRDISKYTWGGLLNGELEGKITTMYTMLNDGITYKPIEFKIE